MNDSRAWIGIALRAAGVYNLAFGAIVLLWPRLLFDLIGMEAPRYPALWQCVGMIVGVYGIGYLIAAARPSRHWPIILVGMLGKILGPLGFLWQASTGALPWSMGWLIVANDLIWWAPFAAALYYAARDHSENPERGSTLSVQHALYAAMNQQYESLAELSHQTPVLAVFLRHLGCPFCREALADLARERERIESCGVQLAIVHMSEEEHAAAAFSRYGLDDVSRIPDPTQELYRAMGLTRGSFWQLFGWPTWGRVVAATLRGHLAGRLEGDSFQMPGAFLIWRGRIIVAFRHRTAGDRPDYIALSCGECSERGDDRAGTSMTALA